MLQGMTKRPPLQLNQLWFRCPLSLLELLPPAGARPYTQLEAALVLHADKNSRHRPRSQRSYARQFGWKSHHRIRHLQQELGLRPPNPVNRAAPKQVAKAAPKPDATPDAKSDAPPNDIVCTVAGRALRVGDMPLAAALKLSHSTGRRAEINAALEKLCAAHPHLSAQHRTTQICVALRLGLLVA